MNGLLRRLTFPLDPDAFRELAGVRRTRRMQGVIESIAPLTADAAEIVVAVGRSWAGHEPGQFVTFGVDIAGVRHTRCYSLTSLSDSRRISIAVQTRPDGFVSEHLVRHARPGQVVALSEPEGDFTLREATSDRLLMLTGGSGITPAMGMIRALADCDEANRPSRLDLSLIHHAPTRSMAMFADELDALADEHSWLHVTLRSTRDGNHSPGGRITRQELSRLCPDWAERDVFACGPAGLIDFAIETWAEAGHADQVHQERFVPAPSISRTTDEAAVGIRSTVTFAGSNVEASASATAPILEVAEQAGLNPASGCRMGICRTCTVPLLHGRVTDLRNGRRSGAGSHVQICVSAATGDVALDL